MGSWLAASGDSNAWFPNRPAFGFSVVAGILHLTSEKSATSRSLPPCCRDRRLGRLRVGWGGGEPSTIAGAPAMPFKANADRRHHIPKQRHRVTNWAEYDAGLRARGSLTVWFTRGGDRGLGAEPRTTPGRAAPLLAPGDRHGADAAGRVPLGAAPDRGADRLHPPAARSRSPGAGPLDPEPPGRDAGGAAATAAASCGPVHLLVDSTGLSSAARASGSSRSTAPSGAGPGECCISRRTPTPAGSSPRC